MDTINYQSGSGGNSIYTTIEVVAKNQPDRLRFVNDENNVSHNGKIIDDLINKMLEYNMIGYKLRMTNKLNPNDDTCSVYSCTSGFNQPELKPYLKIFNTGCIQEKKLILDTLNHDTDPERRAAASFLIGHFTDPQEIISVLSQHINDKNTHVRNNVMRVLWETMRKTHITKIDVRPVIELLDSPYDTDRNKALCVLLAASESKAARQFIIQKGKNKLLSLLRLKQLNNHEEAYFLLKKISGKDYGENNIEAWEHWASQQGKTMPPRASSTIRPLTSSCKNKNKHHIPLFV